MTVLSKYRHREKVTESQLPSLESAPNPVSHDRPHWVPGPVLVPGHPGQKRGGSREQGPSDICKLALRRSRRQRLGACLPLRVSVRQAELGKEAGGRAVLP